MDNLLLLLGVERRPDGVELGQGTEEVVRVDVLSVEVAALGGEFRQTALRRLDFALERGDPLKPRASVHAGIRGFPREALIELPEVSPLGLRLLIDLPPPACHLGEGFGGDRLGQLGVGPKGGGCYRGRRIRSLAPATSWYRMGEWRSLFTAETAAMAPLARQAATHARMTVEGAASREWDSPRLPPRRTAFLLVGTPDGEEIWEGISTEQALALARWAARQFSEDARAGRQAVKASDAPRCSFPPQEDRPRSNPS